MRTRPVRRHATIDELLVHLADAEQDLWSKGGVAQQHRRQDLMAAALAAGCTVEAVARALGATPSDVRTWAPTP